VCFSCCPVNRVQARKFWGSVSLRVEKKRHNEQFCPKVPGNFQNSNGKNILSFRLSLILCYSIWPGIITFCVYTSLSRIVLFYLTLVKCTWITRPCAHVRGMWNLVTNLNSPLRSCYTVLQETISSVNLQYNVNKRVARHIAKSRRIINFSSNRNVIFRCEKGCEEGVFRDSSGNGVALRVPEKVPLVTAL